MNSLTYLSRQFDVLASAKTPPSTATSSKSAFIDDSHINDSQPLKRTWSTKSFFFPPPRRQTPRSSPPKRSHSSPSVTTFASHHQNRASSSTAAPKTLQSKAPCIPSLQAVVRRIFFIRVFVMAWDALCSTYASLSAQFRWWWKSESSFLIQVSTEVSKKGKEKEVIPDVIVEEPMEEDTTTPLVSSPNAPALLNRHHTDPLALPSNSLLRYNQPPTPPNESRSGSRSPTPVLHSRKPLKTLVLDLDETLIHSTSRPMPLNSSASGFFGFSNIGNRNIDAGHTVEVILGGKRTVYHVYKRPFVDFFLRTVSSWYTLVIFTASMREYADPVIDWLDAGRGILGQRLFRDSCTLLDNGQYTKNLTIVDEDLSRVCLIDNSPISYRINEANGIPIEGWTSDPSDEALLDLLPVLDSLRFTSDVRRVLGLRSAGVNMMIHS